MLTLLGVLGGVYWYAFHNQEDLLPELIGITASTVAPTAFVFLLVYLFDAARYARLIRGKGVLVRWEIPPDEWHAFVAVNAQINSSQEERHCLVPRQHIRRTEPVPVVIGETGLLMDGDFHLLPHDGFTTVWPPEFVLGPPAYLEFRMST